MNCHCLNYNITYSPASSWTTSPPDILATMTAEHRADFEEYEARRRMSVAAHEAGHCIAYVAFGASISYASIGGAGHVRARYETPPRLIEALIVDVAGDVADEVFSQHVRRPSVIELGDAARRHHDDLGTCDLCSAVKELRAVLPCSDAVELGLTLRGAYDLAEDCFHRPAWRAALDELTLLLSDRVMLKGEEIASRLDGDALRDDFADVMAQADVRYLLPSFFTHRKVEAGRADRLDEAPDAPSTSFAASDAPMAE